MERPGIEPGTPGGKPCPGVIATAAWLGLMVGLVEVALLLLLKERNHVATIGALRLNRHYPWMIPTSYLVVFGAIGVALELVARAAPRMRRRAIPMMLGGMALLALLLTIRELDTIACVLLAGGLAVQLIPRLGRLSPGLSRVVRTSLPALGIGLVLLVIGRHAQFALAERRASSKAPTARGAPNVLLIVMDTVRARNLSLHGYARETSPRLDRLARGGVKFEQARSTAPWTLPSHASMLTGRLPHELFEHPEQRLGSDVPTLAEYLGARGYATGGFVANTFYCNAGFGLGKGFDHYEDFYETFDTTPSEVFRNAEIGRRVIRMIGEDEATRPDSRKDADRINADFLNWVSTREGRPFFAFLNYLDAHAPFLTPPSAERHFGRRPSTPDELATLVKWQGRSMGKGDPGDLELARDAYDDCIAFLDAALGRLFDELDRKGLLQDTLVIVTSDHGEEIGEHELFGHGRSLYSEELHVPLLVVKPGLVPSGRSVPVPVSLRDIPSTVVDLLGLAGGSPFPGRSLAGHWSAGSSKPTTTPDPVRSEVALREKPTLKTDRPPALRGPMRSIVAEGMVYIRNSNGDEELYRIGEDAEKSRDLADEDDSQPILERFRRIDGSDAEATPTGR